MVLGFKMAHPGLTFAIMVGVAIGTAIYYYFNQENQQQQRQNAYQYNDTDNSEHDFDSWNTNRSSTSSGSQRRRRRNSGSKCSICLEDINKGRIKTIAECGHEFHEHCITMWFRQSKICPNCRRPVYT